MKSKLIQNILNAELPKVDYAEGVWLFDTNGKRYLDGCSGAVVATLGHANPKIIEAMVKQAGKVTFTHRGAFSNEQSEALANRLGDMTGYSGVWFVSSGSEAVEASIQMAMQYFREIGQPERQWFLSSGLGYHGSTLGGLSLSGHIRRTAIAGLGHPFATLPTPYIFRDAAGRSEDDYADDLIEQARKQFEEHKDHLAAVIIEPVGGATLGATVPPIRYIQGLRALCAEYGALFIADEVMTGFGRTGRMLGSQHYDIEPDIVAVGKGLGAGYTPIAAVLLSERVLTAIEDGTGRVQGGHTYSANPLSIATASAVMEILESENVIERGRQAGTYLRGQLEVLRDRHIIIGDVRGLGMLLGLEYVTDPETLGVSLPQGELSGRITAAAMRHGLVIYTAAGGFNDATCIAPPLTITHEEIDMLITSLEAAITDIETELMQEGVISVLSGAAS
ncbi:aspartate aminotransferase family protein [Arthrobacter sp. 4R501]|uniref:aminotransferase family protein n=1 Tax=Arthrobacter sp. 4R501 TaxID=2058886 RepID=UPI0015E282A3|nr:aminotransferase class III-fold pyridoxal phosphate-dependent enzyme [Arthrobacter sp. 4R501]